MTTDPDPPPSPAAGLPELATGAVPLLAGEPELPAPLAAVDEPELPLGVDEPLAVLSPLAAPLLP